MSFQTLLVHPQQLLRSALKELLLKHQLCTKIKTSENWREASDDFGPWQPEFVVLCEPHLEPNGFETLRQIRLRFPRLPILIIAHQIHPTLVNQWLQAGANAYVSSENDIDELRRAYDAVAQGGQYVSGSVAREIVFQSSGISSTPLGDLSRREWQVLHGVVRGNSIQEISRDLFISPKTVSTYRHRLFRKLNLRNDAELTQFVMRSDPSARTNVEISNVVQSNADRIGIRGQTA